MRANFLGLALVVALAGLPPALRPQSDKPKVSPSAQDATCRLRIEITGGDQNKPVSEASVYVKFVEERKLRKDKRMELNLKTSQEGVALTPDIPQGKILIQIVASGWKTYGQYHELTENQQTIQIHLDRPPKWY